MYFRGKIIYFFIITYSLKPTDVGVDFYPLSIFLLDYSLISMKIECFKVER